MRERRQCVICGLSWYRGDSPPCSHSSAEWADYQRRAMEPEGNNRQQRRKLLKVGKGRP